MSGVVNFIVSIFKLAVFFALMGELSTLTKIVLNEAVNAHQYKGISFVKMNKALVEHRK